MQKERKTCAVNLASISNLMSRVGVMESTFLEKDKDGDYFNNVSMVALGLFRVVIMGEIKKGKSSFINAICGIPDMVPVSSDVATSTIFKIRYGQELKYTVYFNERGPNGEIKKLEIQAHEIGEYGTEDGNPDNKKGVDFIAVEAPSQALRGGLMITDTPGVGGLFKKHRDITYNHAPKADAIFFITDSVESPIGNDEVAFLKDLQKVTSLIHFIQTKGAAVGEEDRALMMKNNLNIIRDKVGIAENEVRYFVVDSDLKVLADAERSQELLSLSGYPPLMSYLMSDLKAKKDRNVALMGLRRAKQKLMTLEHELLSSKQILEADSEQKRQQLLDEVSQVEQKFETWNREVKPSLLREFDASVRDIQTELNQSISQSLRPDGLIADEVETVLAHGEFSSQQVYEQAPQFINHVRARASEVVTHLQGELKTRFDVLMRGFELKTGETLSEIMISKEGELKFQGSSGSSLHKLVEKANETHVFESLRTRVYGGTAGVAIASVVGGIIGSVVPVVGTVIGSAAGMIIAGLWGQSAATGIQESRNLEVAKAELLRVVNKELGGIHSFWSHELTKVFATCRSSVEQAMKQLSESQHEQFVSRKNQLNLRSRQDAETVSKKKNTLHGQLRQVSDLKQEILAVEASL